ncbi:Rim2p [Ascoidea rubescens DSM 1968]|uniref:Mitochondrial carrier n=1 Tax=Ascoidea rubescens DSM 1968 TaxID=1344418 RepID=A0A1D2VIN0_9ASCO|nr:mitochondrial carrier [Ascoidea rubescens DSM 1968]ODV61479.1 mitochondrial carrier [Ascoidea rubescens DSM 1968]
MSMQKGLSNENLLRLEKFEHDAEASIPFLVSDEKSSSLKDAKLLPYLAGLKPSPTVNKFEIIDTKKNIGEKTKDVSKGTVKPWVHFVAGGVGGMTGAVFTCPFDVVKTRLQSDVYKNIYKSSSSLHSSNPVLSAGAHLKDTFSIINNLYRLEGFRSLFKGLGPNLVGVIPARSINFFTYGLTKDFIKTNFNNSQEATWIHLLSAANAGIWTSTLTNPIWLIKTRLQLDQKSSSLQREYRNSYDCFRKVMKLEGIKGLYKGLSASYLGSVEGILQWVLYEQMKLIISKNSKNSNSLNNPNYEKSNWDSVVEWGKRSGSAGFAKFIASLITYPHEVIRTRLRQAPMENGSPKYTGIVQCFRLVVKEEGFVSMYGGLTPHLLRTVPNSIIMFGTWEVVTKLLSKF